MSRRTQQLFDSAFKRIMKEASHPAVVHLINGIYKRNYPLDMQVDVKPTEHIKENPKTGTLEKYVSDIVITLTNENRKDTFLLEAQIEDDLDMILRVFNYSTLIALENKTFSKDGSCMQIEMPSPVVIYWETSNTKDIVSIKIRFPNNKTVNYEVPTFKVLQHKVSELENMALLLPFYILKIRKELERKTTDSAKRKELSKRLDGYIADIDKTLKRCKRNSYISEKDSAMLLHRLSRMNNELYGNYKEFTEVNMRLEKLLDTGIDEMIAKERKMGTSRMAKAMKIGGEAIDKIMRYTGLSRREIAAL